MTIGDAISAGMFFVLGPQIHKLYKRWNKLNQPNQRVGTLRASVFQPEVATVDQRTQSSARGCWGRINAIREAYKASAFHKENWDGYILKTVIADNIIFSIFLTVLSAQHLKQEPIMMEAAFYLVSGIWTSGLTHVGRFLACEIIRHNIHDYIGPSDYDTPSERLEKAVRTMPPYDPNRLRNS